ncbi:pancreatic triacylglycerol lipase-like [Choristoneura fumiferana]|uniref:pancreatic triacylglycerol lipase-like n=1 Tax=Choristoneura fumiferana TaxID=7141 RepID=UPI003D156062
MIAFGTMALSVFLAVVAAFAVISGVHTYNPDTENVYHLFSRQNPTVSQPMLLGVPSLVATNFNALRPTVIILHGWSSGPTSPFNLHLIPRVLQAADVNVIAVDWSAGAYEPDYNGVVNTNVPLSADSIGRFIFWLNLVTGSSLDLYHIIGFEVGGHLGGLVGRSLNGLVPFITALNPPRTGWNETNMFRPSDGLATEAIHTDVFGSGMLEPVADCDFYPNGGLVMPGCYWVDWECSRDRSYQYFAESIVSGGFTSVKCESTTDALEGNCDSEETIVMGGLVDKSGRSGIFYLTTNAQAPFSTG